MFKINSKRQRNHCSAQAEPGKTREEEMEQQNDHDTNDYG